MIPKEGQHIKCVLRNGVIAEGILEEWFANYVKLKSLDGESVLIIHHPNDDIVFTKIILNSATIENKKNITETPTTQLQIKFQEAYEQPSVNEARTKTLVELKRELAEEEKKIIAHKLKTHYIGANIGLSKKYVYPNLYTKSIKK